MAAKRLVKLHQGFELSLNCHEQCPCVYLSKGKLMEFNFRQKLRMNRMNLFRERKFI